MTNTINIDLTDKCCVVCGIAYKDTTDMTYWIDEVRETITCDKCREQENEELDTIVNQAESYYERFGSSV